MNGLRFVRDIQRCLPRQRSSFVSALGASGTSSSREVRVVCTPDKGGQTSKGITVAQLGWVGKLGSPITAVVIAFRAEASSHTNDGRVGTRSLNGMTVS